MREPFALGAGVIRLAIFCAVTAQVLAQPTNNSDGAVQFRAALDQYCVTCHNQKLKTGGLTLEQTDITKIGENAEIWEKVRRKLHDGSMPPPRMPRPNPATYKTLAAWLEAELDREALAHPNPGSPSIHRLNRAEYVNAIRDLLALEIDGRGLLPADDSGYGFDNIGDMLTVSPVLMERYLAAAQKVSQMAIGTPDIAPAFETYKVSGFLRQEDRMSEDLPFGSRGGTAVRYRFPLDGEYVIRITLQKDFAEQVRGLLGEPRDIDVFVDGTRIRTFKIGGPQYLYNSGFATGPRSAVGADAGLEVRFPARAGMRLVAVTFPKATNFPEDVKRPVLARDSFAFTTVTDGKPDISTLQIGGPFSPQGPGDTASRRAIFTCRPSTAVTTGSATSADSAACAKKILSALARRAYRRPATERDVRILMEFFQTGERESGFDYGIQTALQRILISPEFLFRIERDPANVKSGTIYGLSGLELASRLSFFLWSSLPDDQLVDLAASDKLKDPAVLEQQVRRMLADRRSEALVSNFAGQWLWLRNLRSQAPDGVAFPEWDDNLREGLQRETELFFQSMVQEDHGVPELLDANYTFLNERLAQYYGIPNVYGSRYRRVTLPEGQRRGLLGQGSILTVTSYANRTSPTKRGAWLLENILNAPSPPPPPNVPPLKDNGENGQFLSMRERMEQHRKNPVCASCHARMDPLGFALENFDAIGRWRREEFGKQIDAAAALPDGTKFNGVNELRNLLLSHREDFVQAVTEKLMTYALGRGVGYPDLPTVRAITKASAPGGYRWSEIILGIVKSPQFQKRMSASLQSASAGAIREGQR